jgi:predicted dehydrogenase
MLKKRIGMGLVGPGFVGVHHIDAVRRLGFVDVVAIAASTEASARRKADSLGVSRAYGSYEELVADPDVHVVHNTTPNYLHGPVIKAALAHGKHIVSDKPLAMTATEARELWNAASLAGVVHAVTFNYRGNPLVQQAREMVASGELGGIHFVHGAYLQDWLIEPTDFSWRLEPEKGGASSAVGDIGSHWCDLVQHVVGQRIVEVLADLTTVVGTRLRPSASPEAFARTADVAREPFAVRSEDLASIILRFDGGAKACVSVGQVCAGHKNDLWFEVSGRHQSLRWRQEQQNELWIGRRDAANAVLPKDPSLLGPVARAYAHLPGGHQEAWADAFRNVLRDVYQVIADLPRPSDPKPPAFATFEDGYRAACVVDAILESHRCGSVWTKVYSDEAGSIHAGVRETDDGRDAPEGESARQGPGDRAGHGRLAGARSPRT